MKLERLMPFAFATFVCLCLPICLSAQELTPILVVDGLKNPTAVAVQPKTGILFIAESGAHRIIKISGGKVIPVIEGFRKDVYGKSPIYEIGPLSMVFAKENVLYVGTGGSPDGEDRISGFTLPDDDDALPLDATKPDLGEPQLKTNGDLLAEGDFYSLAKGNKGIYTVCNGDDTKGWIARAKINQEYFLTSLVRIVPTAESTKTSAPMAVTFNTQGHMVVGHMGKTDANKDSTLSFYSEEGAHLDTFPLGLHDLTGLAYGPKHGRLFATDFHWSDPANGGLYKIIGTNTPAGCKTQLISKLSRPTSLAFTQEGDLYVTLAGDPTKNNATGKLVLFKAMDVDQSK